MDRTQGSLPATLAGTPCQPLPSGAAAHAHVLLLLCWLQILAEDTPAKCGGPPGNAFEMVYGGVTDLVRKKMHAADPALGEWIRCGAAGGGGLAGSAWHARPVPIRKRNSRWALMVPPAPRRCHLYGDLYSSPGLDLRQKQLLACAFLGVAHMPDQLFGHALAVGGV